MRHPWITLATSYTYDMERTSSHSSDSGYDYQFVDTPLDRVVCVICHLPSRDPHMTECCGHVYCKSCLDKAKATRYASCSMCKDYDFNTFCNKQINREVQCLRVYCTNKEKGCEWKGEVKDISTHLEHTGGCHFGVKCLNDCEEPIQRQYLASHIKSECPHREVEYQYCCEKVKMLSLMVHTLKNALSFLYVPCQNSCEKAQTILHEDMEAHRKDCPLEVIQCEYQCGV